MGKWLPKGIRPDFSPILPHPLQQNQALWPPWQGCCVCVGQLPLVHLPSTYIWIELGPGLSCEEVGTQGQLDKGQPGVVLAPLRRA